jgi:phosphatidylglycerol---prolipoprotein diacylglyceryl transferase
VVLSAIIGARFLHVVDAWKYYAANPGEILLVQHGGLAFFGGLSFGVIGLLAYLKAKKQDVLYWLDCVALYIPLGQAIGRWGNYFNHELYGRPTSAPWGIYIPLEKRIYGYEYASYFHPLFLYESVLNVVLFIVLNNYAKHVKCGSGKLLGLYFVGYGSIRFSLEFLRIGQSLFLALSVSQYLALLLVLVGVALLRKPKLV